jgi:azurin
MKNLIVPFSLLVVLSSSCGDSGSKQNTTGAATSEVVKSVEFTVNAIGNTMADMAYDTKELKVKSGSKVKINLTNQGTDAAMLHNIVFVKQGAEKEVAMEGINLKDQGYFNSANTNIIAGSAVAGPGLSVTLEFVAPEPGTYTYICTYPGHWMKMQGLLIVE